MTRLPRALVWAAAALVVGGAALPATYLRPAEPEVITDEVDLATSASRAKAGIGWVDDLCKATVPTYQAVTAPVPDDPETFLADYSNYLKKISSAAASSASDLSDVETSPFKNGKTAVTNLVTYFTTLRDATKESRKRINALKKFDLEEISEAQWDGALEPLAVLEKMVDPVDALSRSGEVKTAYDKARSCRQLATLVAEAEALDAEAAAVTEAAAEETTTAPSTTTTATTTPPPTTTTATTATATTAAKAATATTTPPPTTTATTTTATTTTATTTTATTTEAAPDGTTPVTTTAPTSSAVQESATGAAEVTSSAARE